MAHNNPFHMPGLNMLVGAGTSNWARFLPAGNYHAIIRGVLARELRSQIREEGVVRDPDTQEAISAISMLSSGLPLNNSSRITGEQVGILIRSAIGADGVSITGIGAPITIHREGLPYHPGDNFPVNPDVNGNYTLNPGHWNDWMEFITNNRPANNNPQGAPAGLATVPAPGELHPWAFAGYLDVNLTDGQPLGARAAAHGDLGVLCILIILVASVPGQGRVRAQCMNLLVLGVAILTSGGSITQARVRRINQAAARETGVDNIDITRDQVIRGWDVLSSHWRTAERQSAQFQEIFTFLGEQFSTVSLRLGLMAQQSEFRMLTGITMTVRSMSAFREFPWIALNEQIANQTGRNELTTVLEFANYIDPRDPNAAARGGHWSGWQFALREARQGAFVIANFVNLLYTAWQLSIKVGGNMTMQQYQGLEGHVIPLRPMIDAWIQQYLNGRAAPVFNLYQPEENQVDPRLLELYAHNI